MKRLNVAIVGGGPSGLYFAYLLKKSCPDWRVRVFEQNAPDATFGFGVVIADRGLARLEAADADSARALIARSHVSRDQVIYHNGHPLLVDRVGYGNAIGRLDLLDAMQGLCRTVGVELLFNFQTSDDGQLDAHDLVVGADGINSCVRTVRAEAFGTRITRLTNHFAWYGTRAKFERPALSFKKYDAGYLCAHYYPYSESMGTFVAECDDGTWQRLGLEAMSDADRQSLIERAFEAELDGHPLIFNKSLWRQFPVVGNDRWSCGKRVLVGDALHSAHFSIGSGTRIAMEDSIALWEALTSSADVESALARFETTRRPAKTKLLDAARASYTWYETFPERLERMAPLDFVYDFMTRTGRMDVRRLRLEHPNFMALYERERRSQQAMR